jgi:hypothetical protein
VVGHVTFRMMQVTFFSTEDAQSEAPPRIHLIYNRLCLLNQVSC